MRVNRPRSPPRTSAARAATRAKTDSTRATTPGRASGMDATTARRPGKLTGLAAAIDQATKLPRSTGPEGSEAMLTPHERERLEKALATAAPELRARLTTLATSFAGDAAPIASALFLRAVTARADRLATPATLHTLEAFAARARTLPADELRLCGTVLDLDSTRNDGHFDPLGLWDKRGNTKPVPADGASDNDGLYQRFTASCGPTVLQMVLAEADPVMAFALHDAGLRSDSTTDEVATFQRAILEELGGVAVGRRDSHTAARLHNLLGRLVANKTLTSTQRDALVAHARGDAPLTVAAARALEAVRDASEGFPTDGELERLCAARLPARDEGVDTLGFVAMVNRRVGELTGVRYEMTNGPDGFARGKAGPWLDQVEQTLAQGIDVPFGVSEPAHWMLLTHVKRENGTRQFLVSDPDGGRTAWVTEKDFLSGQFAKTPFRLPTDQQRPYVDSFFLPKR